MCMYPDDTLAACLVTHAAYLVIAYNSELRLIRDVSGNGLVRIIESFLYFQVYVFVG